MTRTLEIQILVYMAIIAIIAFAWGYTRGHRDGVVIGRIQARKLERVARGGK